MKNNKVKFGFVFILCILIGCLSFGIHLKSYANNSNINQKYYYKLLHQAFDDSNWEKLKTLSDTVIKIYPNNEIGYFFKGIALDELGYYEESIENYTKAIKIRPLLSDTYQNRGYVYLKMKQYDKAIADYNKSLLLDPNSEITQEQREKAINAKKGIVVTKEGNITNFQSVNDPIYLANEYKELPEVQKKKYIDGVTNYDNDILPVYYFMVAEDIYPSDKKLAAFLYYIGLFRSLEDVLMCKNKSAHKAVILLPHYAPKTANYLTKMGNKELKNLMQNVLDWDEKHPDRPDPKWICYYGIDVMNNNDEVETYSKSEYENIKKEIRMKLINIIQQKKVTYKRKKINYELYNFSFY